MEKKFSRSREEEDPPKNGLESPLNGGILGLFKPWVNHGFSGRIIELDLGRVITYFIVIV